MGPWSSPTGLQYVASGAWDRMALELECDTEDLTATITEHYRSVRKGVQTDVITLFHVDGASASVSWGCLWSLSQ